MKEEKTKGLLSEHERATSARQNAYFYNKKGQRWQENPENAHQREYIVHDESTASTSCNLITIGGNSGTVENQYEKGLMTF